MPNLLTDSFMASIDGAGGERRGLEGPGALTARELMAAIGGGPTRAGVDISESSALTIGAVWAAVRALSQSVAILPLRVRRLTAAGWENAETHPAYPLLAYRPNPYMSAYTLFDTLMGHATLWGNCYARIVWNGANKPREILPISPRDIAPERKAGQLVYRSTVRNETFAAEEIIHVPGPGFDGLKGYSVISYAREELGLGKAVQQFGSGYFGNGATMKGVLQLDKPMELSERIELGKAFDRMHSGANGGQTAVLTQGTKYERIGLPPEDSQFLETRRFSVQDVARWFGVPVHMLGDLERATFSNIEEQNLWFLQTSLTPWLLRFEQEIDFKLFGYASEFRCSFDEREMRRADVAKRQTFYALGRQWGYLSVNEIRELEQLPRIEGGDVYLQPVNMAKSGGAGADDPAPAPKPPAAPKATRAADVERLTPVLRDAVARMNRKERNIRERQTGDKLAAQLVEHRTHIVEALAAALGVIGDADGIAERFADGALASRTAAAAIDDAHDLEQLKGLLQP